MKLIIRLPFEIVRRDVIEEMYSLRSSYERLVKDEKKSFEEAVRKAIHNAQAGIVCDVCHKNVYRGEGTWVHGNGGKAYCLKPCWEKRNEAKETQDDQPH